MFAAALLLAAAPADAISGTWEGTSLCQVKPSPCRDEHALYRFTQTAPGRYRLDGYKLVGGKELFMGPMNVAFDAARGELRGTIGSNRGPSHLRLILKSSRLRGQLTLGDGTIYRLIDVTKR
jgi:hypothetical protein